MTTAESLADPDDDGAGLPPAVDARVRCLRFPDPGNEDGAPEMYRAWLAPLLARTMDEITAGRPNPDVLLDDREALGVHTWMSLRKHAIALHPIYNAPGLTVLGDGLTMSDFDEPLEDDVLPFRLWRRWSVLSARSALASATGPCSSSRTPMPSICCSPATSTRSRSVGALQPVRCSLSMQRSRGPIR